MDEAQSALPPEKWNTTLWYGIVLEAGLVICALGLSAIGLYDPLQRLRNFGWVETRNGMIWGSAASLPLIGYLVAFHFFPLRWMRSLRQFCIEHLRPMFAGTSIWELALLSIAAGVGEELLFRWCFQGGITAIFEPRFGQPAAGYMGLFLASLAFGLCHAVTKLYFTVTFIGGLFLGWTMIATTNWLVPGVAHAIYDFVALVYIVKIMDCAAPLQSEH